MSAFLAERQPALVDEEVLEEIRAKVGPVSTSYLKHLLLDAGVPLSPLVEGVVQSSFEELERTLIQLLDEYERGDRERARSCREAVIAGKDHARFALKRATDPAKAAAKQEMLLWMMTWLENPAIFRDWLSIRKRTAPVLEGGASSSDEERTTEESRSTEP